MKTILVTGGTDGIGKGLVMQYLKEGHRVFAVGRSTVKGNGLIKEAETLGKKENGQNAQFHGSRLNDLLAVSFHEKNKQSKIKYILFNPMAARTNGASMMGEGNPFMKLTMKLYYKFMGKDVSEIVSIINQVTSLKTNPSLVAYKLDQLVDLTMGTFQSENAKQLDLLTAGLLKDFMVVN